ncbi:sigma-54-dependent transcriptional regulator [Shewanella ulleungensis]|uniref:Sigma-54-dependent Fis family transcriptional regulator n=1 Tax=Shewanella ulleungensis TaxID=2282699 RepID=A0ABQ2QD06_9GAMM|nr:sigma-54 dependent transcriptional regulator [Shewanella ulleungensis]MCL1148736.1 sigma-54 dependent transcriptional regulator [Shewanella ulleungensis]GGP75928.1 sigma-54-dependent Fis family transcriptional regulator [Shewanella ulleungensis]
MNTTQKPLVYVVEDSLSSGALYCSQLKNAGFETEHFVDGYSALVAIKAKMPAVLVQDVCLPDISGLEVLKYVNKQEVAAKVIIITSNSSIDVAVDAMRLGGYDFIEKPFTSERLITSVSNAIKQQNQDLKTVEVEPEATALDRINFIGESLSMHTVFRLLESAARSKASVFVTGESGTGKEVCALGLHQASAREQGPFIAINCAAIPAELFESEFFGHVKGAFSGALTDRKGAVEVANGGTLFLDEICEMQLNLQAKLLRFLQTGTFCKVGSSEVLQSDVRIVCATNRNPAEEVGEGRFREDLYYRLNVIPVVLPPLRDRGEDILLLANHILTSKTTENNKKFENFSNEVKQIFMQYDWPGNIRELQNVIENIVVIYDGQSVQSDMLPNNFGHSVVNHYQYSPQSPMTQPKASAVSNTLVTPQGSMPTQSTAPNNIIQLWIVEKNAIEDAISQCDGNIPLAAAYLGISASTIYRKMKSWAES